MKKVLLCAAFIAASFTSIAQVGVGTTTPDASAALEIESTTKGFLPPRMDTAARNAIVSPKAGLVIYNTTANGLQWFNGTDWYDARSNSTENPSLILGNTPSYQGTSVIDATGIGYNGEAVPAASTITVQLTNNAAIEQTYELSATHAGTGLIYSASGTIAASPTTVAVILTHNAVVMPDLESGVLTMPLFGASTILNLVPRIDIKSIPASATTITDVEYGTQTWMDRNLGARRVGTAYNDAFSHGNLYQWGRPADGHEITVRNGTDFLVARLLADANAPGALAASATPGYDDFIIPTSSPNDWLENPAASGENTLWATTNQGPCPTGYHVPSNDEWDYADTYDGGTATNGGSTVGWDTYIEAYDSDLKLPANGLVTLAAPTVTTYTGVNSYYWGSSVVESKSTRISLHATKSRITAGLRYYGYGVRCIKN